MGSCWLEMTEGMDRTASSRRSSREGRGDSGACQFQAVSRVSSGSSTQSPMEGRFDKGNANDVYYGIISVRFCDAPCAAGCGYQLRGDPTALRATAEAEKKRAKADAEAAARTEEWRPRLSRLWV